MLPSRLSFSLWEACDWLVERGVDCGSSSSLQAVDLIVIPNMRPGAVDVVGVLVAEGMACFLAGSGGVG